MEFKTVLATNKDEFQQITELRTGGWTMDPSAKSSGPMSVDGVGVVYHLVKYSAEELQALAAAQLATQQQPAFEVADFVALPVEATKAEPGSDSLIKKYLDAGYVVDVQERIAAKSTKTVNLYKPKPKPETPAQTIPVQAPVITEENKITGPQFAETA